MSDQQLENTNTVPDTSDHSDLQDPPQPERSSSPTNLQESQTVPPLDMSKTETPAQSSRGRTPTRTHTSSSLRRTRSASATRASRSMGYTQRSNTMRSRTSRSLSRTRRSTIARNFIDSTDTGFVLSLPSLKTSLPDSLEHTIERYQRSPGPVYHTGKEKDLTLRRSTTVRIGTEDRAKHFLVSSLGPGPACYRSGDYQKFDEKISDHMRSPRATIGKYKPPSILIDTNATGGPPIGLPPIETTFRRSFRATIGNAPRGSNSKIITPGPADYVSKPGLPLLSIAFSVLFFFHFVTLSDIT